MCLWLSPVLHLLAPGARGPNTPPLQTHPRFVTGGFDRFLRVWDTETGQVIQTVTNRKVRTYIHTNVLPCGDKPNQPHQHDDT